MKGKTIRLYLTDGIPTGVLTAEIINWTGKVIVAPRSKLADLAGRPEVRRTGVYCLVGPDPESIGKDRVYFGEADNILVRLASHDRDTSKDFWTRAALIISKDENVTKSHGRYLESRLIQLAVEADRASLANGTAPAVPPLPEPDIADMEFFLDQIQMILPVLGFSFLLPKPIHRPQAEAAPQSPTFELRIAGTFAKAIESNGELVVLQGSTARKEGTASWDSYRSQRDQLVADRKLRDSDDPNYYVFAEDVPFNSPSAAATVVAAANCNGRSNWRISSTGQTYADWQEAKLEAATRQGDSVFPSDDLQVQ